MGKEQYLNIIKSKIMTSKYLIVSWVIQYCLPISTMELKSHFEIFFISQNLKFWEQDHITNAI
ncbi:hypothetical protein C9J01_05915 [Photobacterium rosenbergii]|uniref:Uncharacterized protein n=1 Tax=Photobacterium rosenbergii TaxID=294936 RepID=A0A2T3NLY6_9GAMM|nr:hypothetical protein C9J01_05915 [Photobacterium rosenbergii]